MDRKTGCVTMTDSTDLMPRATIAQMVATWDECSRDLREAYRLLVGVQERLSDSFSGGSRYFEFDHHDPAYSNYREPERAIASLELRVWGALVDRLELRKLLSLAAIKQLDEMTEHRRGGRRTDETLGPITVENVSNVLRGMLAAIPDQLNIAVREVYDALRPHHSKLKTNSRYEVGAKVIIEGAVQPRFCSVVTGGYHADKIRALDRVFHMLDGKGLVPQTHWGELIDALNAARGTGEGESQYFRFRFFANGNLHLWFKRADLLLRFNQIAGAGQLKPKAA